MSPSKMKFRDNDNNILDGAGSEVDNVGHWMFPFYSMCLAIALPWLVPHFFKIM
jgi:hypothetical protein